MAMNDVFNSNAFSMVELTAAINAVPYKPGFLSGRGIFTDSGVTTETVAIEEKGGVLRLVQSKPRNGPRVGKERTRRKIRTFNVPHLPQYDYIRADELVNVRAFGQEQGFETEETVRNERLASMADDLDLTLEHHRLGAIKGQVLDADGTVIHDLFEEFDVSPIAEKAMDLGNATEGNLIKKVQGIKRAMLTELGGVTPSGIEVLCGDNYWDDLVSSPDAREYYRRAAQTRLGDAPVYDQFVFAGITWINYRGAGDVAVHTDKCHFYPTGVKDLFPTRYAPAPWFSTVNTKGLPRYSRHVPGGDTDVQLDLEAQTNPLVLCTRPRVLIQGKRGA